MSSGSACWILWLTPMDWLALSIGRSGSQPLEYSRCSGKVNWLTSYDNEEYKNMTENTRLEIALKYSKIISIPNIILCCYLFVIDVHLENR